MAKFSRIIFILSLLFLSKTNVIAQVSSVTFGKNRVQYKKFKWQYYQSKNFNVYFNEGGQEIAKYVVQLAEADLEQIEAAAEYSLQRRANIIIYNHFSDFKQTNIGLETDLITTGGVTKLVNNKMIVFFDGNHADLRTQIRQGIANVLTQNVLFGDDISEIASNQTLLDLPPWFTEGYVSYLGENWSTTLDDELRSEILSGNYKNFYEFAFRNPQLAGHAFWYYIEEKYKKENVTYFLYLARIYKNLNKASVQISKMRFKPLLRDFMEYNEDKYYKDLSRRKAYPKGNYVEGFTINKRLNYYRFNVNPNKRNNSYVVSQYKNGKVRVLLSEDFEFRTLLKYGVRQRENEIHPSYPIMAWDPKGTQIAVIYPEEGRAKLFVYDLVNRQKQSRIDLSNYFDQVQDMKYMLDNKTLLLSAVKNGHTDIFTFNIEKGKVLQITNDVYDDLDASFVAFPNKTGILFASNRPSADAPTADTVLPSNYRYNIFMVTNFGDKPELNQITQLSDLKYGNARYPMQYNTNHFTFISDDNGIANRYAGFFSTRKEGYDTMVIVGPDILRNPSPSEIDSALIANNLPEITSTRIISISSDSAYTFPLTNYPSNVAETRIAGDNNQVSEVTRQSDEKILYKLKIDDYTLRNRNITARPTEYMRKVMRESELTSVKPAKVSLEIKDTTKQKVEDVFQTEFEREDISVTQKDDEGGEALKSAKLYRYKPLKFFTDFGSLGLNNSVLINRYQPYTGASGPVRLNSSTPLNGLIRIGTSELMEDLKITGGFRISTNLKDNEWMGSFQYLKRRIDWGFTYYRSAQGIGLNVVDGGGNSIGIYPGKSFTNLYQGNISYPFDEIRSIRLSLGIRSERLVALSVDPISLEFLNDKKRLDQVTHGEFVYDNSLSPIMNIWDGLRYKIFFDWNRQINDIGNATGPNIFNAGFDARYYYPIYRYFTWSGRIAGDFSWGNQKMIYYLGGMDGWLMFGDNKKYDRFGRLIKERFFNTANRPDPDADYAYESLSGNLRGYIQNAANGNNAVVINSEFRLPIVSTFFDKPINNAFLSNFQIIQFVDLGTAWNGKFSGIKRPDLVYGSDPVTVKVKAGGLGPFVGGYGFGARSMLLGYFVKFDVGWPMEGFFRGKPIMYLSLGLDF